MQVRKNDGVYAIELSFFWNSTESRRRVILWWYVTYLLSMIFKISWKIRLLYGYRRGLPEIKFNNSLARSLAVEDMSGLRL